MTISEFKAWLEGFSEGIDGAPSPEQWARIQEKVRSLHAFVDLPSLPQWPTYTSPAVVPLPYSPTTCGGASLAAFELSQAKRCN
jgi:hypothetical protein